MDRGPAKHVAVLVCAAIACVVSAAPAAAQTRWTVSGHGFGHGVGMSQYGAYGYALHGRDYHFILGHYYRGTTIGTAPRRPVRVLLTVSRSVSFSRATRACGRRLNSASSYRARRAGAGVQLLAKGRVKARCGIKLRATGKGRVRIRGQGAYRGSLEVVPSSSGRSLNVINALSIDRYVRGVVAGEMPSSWPLEALKAQAVAARSYALSGGLRGNGFGLYDDTRSQVYRGIAGETDATNRAVAETAREVVMHGGEIARAYYSASSGGETENVEYGFPGSTPVPYLEAVDDPYDTTSPLHSWRRVFTQSEMQSQLGRYVRGTLENIQITRTGISPRIVSANLIGSAGTTRVSGADLQSALGLYSTWMTFSKSG